MSPRQETCLVIGLVVLGAVLWADSINEWVFDEDWTRGTYAILSIVVGINRLFRARWNWSRSCAAAIANASTAFYSFVIAWVFASFTIHEGGISQLDGARWLRGPLILQMAFLCLGFWFEHRWERDVGRRTARILAEDE